MLADELDYVLGVDTHRDEHVIAVVTAPAGAVVAGSGRGGERRGYRELLRCRGAARAGPARLGDRGHRQLRRRARPLPRRTRRDGARDQPHTARRAAAARQRRRPRRRPDRTGGACQRDARLPRAGEPTGSAAAAADRSPQRRRRTPRGTDPAARSDRDRPRRAPPGAPRAAGREGCSTAAAASAAPQPQPTSSRRGSCCAASPAASRPQPLEADELEREILAHVRALAPALLDEPGVGPIVAAQLIVAWSHHGRLRSEASFARLAGVAPIPASSGQTTRHRLSRGGDRQLNRALHTIVLHRRQHDPATKTRHKLRCLFFIVDADGIAIPMTHGE